MSLKKQNILINQIDLFILSQKGVYCIYCSKTKKSYIGETRSFLERAARHWSLLKANIHECTALQKDFNKYGCSFFQFEVLFLESDRKKRLQLEKQLIQEKQWDKLYNEKNSFVFRQKGHVLGQSISINKKIYVSIREAEKMTGVSKSTIIRRLNNQKELSSIRLGKAPIQRGKYNFIINHIVYASTKEVIENKLAKSDNQVRERCRSKSPKWKSWKQIRKKV